MKKIVLKLDIHDNKCKTKAMKKASGISGVDSVALDPKDNKLTVTGDIDPVVAVSKLRKVCHTEIVSVGPAKEPEKKKEEPKKEEPKKDGAKKDEPKKEPQKAVPIPICSPYYYAYQPQMSAYYPPPPSDFGYGCKVVEEYQPTCVIC